MRWLTLTVAGSYCCRWFLVGALLTGAAGVAQSQTVEISRPARPSAAAPDYKRTVAQVTVVTEGNGNEGDPTPPPPKEFNPDRGGPVCKDEGDPAPPELFPPILPQLPEYGE